RGIEGHELLPDLLAPGGEVDLREALRHLAAHAHVQRLAVLREAARNVAGDQPVDRSGFSAVDRIEIVAAVRPPRSAELAVASDAPRVHPVALRRDGLGLGIVDALYPETRTAIRFVPREDDPAAVRKPGRLLDAHPARWKRLGLAGADRIEHDVPVRALADG